MRDRVARDPANLLDSLHKEAVLGGVREVIEADLLDDQPVELLAAGELEIPDGVREPAGEQEQVESASAANSASGR